MNTPKYRLIKYSDHVRDCVRRWIANRPPAKDQETLDSIEAAYGKPIPVVFLNASGSFGPYISKEEAIAKKVNEFLCRDILAAEIADATPGRIVATLKHYNIFFAIDTLTCDVCGCRNDEHPFIDMFAYEDARGEWRDESHICRPCAKALAEAARGES